MINTDQLSLGEIAELNSALKNANVTLADVRQIAQELNLGEDTVKRWFDATNNGDYSEAIPAAAVGKEDYLLQNNGEVDQDEYGESPAAYTGDRYLDNEDQDGDIEEGVSEDGGITDPSEASLHERILLAALISSRGYGRETVAGETFTGVDRYEDLPVFSTLFAAKEYCEDVMNGRVTAYLRMAWKQFNIDPQQGGGYRVRFRWSKKTDQDPSP